MVAYSFKRRFAPAIKAGTKCQTIRGERARHARVGERVQLYTGMRTKLCARVIPDPIVDGVHAVLLVWDHTGFTRICVMPSPLFEAVGFEDEGDLHVDNYDAFAVADGFNDQADMFSFWHEIYAGLSGSFQGALIHWQADAP